MNKTFLNNCKSAGKVYRAINHPVRQQILEAIETTGKTVTQLIVEFRVEQSVMSQQLGILRRAKLVKAIRNGKFMIYSINTEALAAVGSANISLGYL